MTLGNEMWSDARGGAVRRGRKQGSRDWVTMKRRTWRLSAACGLMVVPLGMAAQTAAPRYQSPFGAMAAGAPGFPKPPAITANGTVVEDVIARVNDQIIDRSDLERSEAQLEQELQQNNASAAERADKQKDMLRDLIDQQLLLSKGKELGLNGDTEVVRRLDEIRKQNHLDTMEDLEKAARQQGVNFEDFKANIRNGVITQQVVRDEVGRRLQMTQAQEQAFYEAHKGEFAQPEQVRLSEILIPAPADATEAQLVQAKTKADGIVDKLKTGGNFEELAKANSGGQTAAAGGDLGEWKPGTLAKVFEDETFKLKVGESTAPIRTKQGFVILKVTGHQNAGIPPLKEIEPQIQEAMYGQQMAPALRAYLTRLREEAALDVAPGFVDTGASSKQTKFVFTSYAAPTPKKKSQVQKARFERAAVGNSSAAATGGLAALPAGTGPALVPDATGHVAGRDETSTAGVTTQAPVTGKVRQSARVSSNGKVKKPRREKVRFGQAPRNALPAGPEEQAQVGSDTGAGANSAAVTPGGIAGAVAAPTESTTQVASSADVDPLARKPEATGKTRFSSRDAEFRAERAAAKQAKVKEKVVATPAGPDKQEVTTAKVQAAPLGLSGDTVKKKKRVKVKGAAKERLQEKKPDTTQVATPAPTVSPALAPPGAGAPTPPASSNDRQTTLPAKDAAVPGAPPQGQPLPPDGSPQTTPNGTPAAQPQR